MGRTPNDEKRRRLMASLAGELHVEVICAGCKKKVQLTEQLECPNCGRRYLRENIDITISSKEQ